VYAVGRPPATPADRAGAAVLACGDRAALGRFGAATLWSIWDHWPDTFDVIAPTDRRRPGIRTHHIVLPPQDLRHHLGVRVTCPARVLLDCAPRISDAQVKRLVNNARVNKSTRVTDEQLADIVARNPRHPGARALRWFVDHDAGHRSESTLEDILFPWCDRYGVPRPLTQVPLHGFRVDALHPDEKVVLELDGWDFHRGRESFESDRDRDAELAMHGFLVVRITWERFEQRPEREATRLLKILAARRRAVA